MTFKPRNHNERTREAPKATARWFDNQAERNRKTATPCGFHIPKGEDG